MTKQYSVVFRLFIKLSNNVSTYLSLKDEIECKMYFKTIF